MGQCSQCGNHYDKSFDVSMNGKTYTFDSFECAIQKLSPSCLNCRCRIIGHGVEKEGDIYCCSHCAEKQGAEGLVDRID